MALVGVFDRYRYGLLPLRAPAANKYLCVSYVHLLTALKPPSYRESLTPTGHIPSYSTGLPFRRPIVLVPPSGSFGDGVRGM